MVALNDTSRRRLAHFVRRSIIGLALLVAAVSACAALMVLMQRGWPLLEDLDRGVATAFDRALDGRPAAATALTAITALGGNAVMWWLATVTAAGMVLRRQLQLAAFLVVTGLGALALAPLVKLLVLWLPPDRPGSAMAGAGNEFPSGHALNAVVFYGALLLVFLPVIPRRLRAWAIGLVAALVVVIGLARAALGVQYASDILGGWLIGLAWLAVPTYAFRRWRSEIGREPHPLMEGLEPEAASVLAPGRTAHMRHPERAAAAVLAAWAVVAAVVIGLGLLVTWAAPGFDDALPRWLAAHRTSQLDAVVNLVGRAGNTQAVLSIGLVIAPLAIGCVHRWRPAVFLAVLMFGEFAMVLTSAALVRRPTPAVPLPGDDLPGSAFPAGPTAATVCLYGALAVILVPRTRPRGWLRSLTVAVVVLVPTGVALSGLYRGAHRPLDVAGAVLLGLLWLSAVTLALDPNADLHQPPPAVPVVATMAGSPAAAGPPDREPVSSPENGLDVGTSTARSGTHG